ncbi:MAG: DJ-1/PfpI family protein [Gammaproteobacteria bacterium]|nr:DJ-1/PfpI family protein [Gammaproteobacteria bacterium]
MTKKILIPLAQGCEELEAVTLIDLFRRAGFEVITAGLDERVVHCARGTVIIPDTSLDQVLQTTFDMVVLPGGQPGTNHLDADTRIHDIVQRHARQAKYVCAICAAPKVLANAGLLAGKRATAFPGTLETLQVKGMQLEAAAVVQDGLIVTSRGPGTAMDFALALIELLAGAAAREKVETPLQRPTRG